MNEKQLEKLNNLFAFKSKCGVLLLLTAEKLDEYYQKDDRVHGIDHALNTTQIALKIANYFESCNRIELMYASLFHDIGHNKSKNKDDHSVIGGSLIKNILRDLNNEFNKFNINYSFNENSIERIASCIALHSFSNRCSNPISMSIEEKILYDADKIDLFGYHGIVRLIAYADQSKDRISALDNIIKEYDRKLKLIPDSLYLSVSQDILKEQMEITQQLMEYI